MKFNIDINKDKTVATVTASLTPSKVRLPFGQRETVRTADVTKKFAEEYPNLKIVSCSGPSKITNFHGPERASGTWTITLEKGTTKTKKQQRPPSTRPRTSTKKGA